MENASSNLSELVSRFAKVCKFRSVGVFPDQKPNSNGSCLVEILGETVINHKPSRRDDDDEIWKLFDLVSGLKLAYLEFQQAHLPYDPDKIVEADNLVVSQLEALRKFKRLYLKTKQLHAKTELVADASSCLDRLRGEIQANEKQLEKLKARARTKESEIHSLKVKLNCLADENRKLKERVVSVSSFEFAFCAASKSVHDFAKPLITLMKATYWNLDKAVDSIVGNVRYAKKSDKKYAFESYIVRRMFDGVKLNPCDDVTDVMKFDDPLEALTAYPDSAFSRFFGRKYLLVVHPSMEASFFGNLDMRALVLLGKHPRTMFYRIFARMAKWVWILGSLDLKANIFVVRRGTRFSSVYMESVVGDEKEGGSSVEFITMPGFKIGDTVVKSQVYLSKTQV